jgi:hypothetical protein
MRPRPWPALIAAAVAGVLLAPAAADARTSYCSPSGDVCFAARRVDGRVTLMLDTFSFTGRVRVCVRPPGGGAETCRRFRLRQAPQGLYRIRARWSAHFPAAGPGVYRVRFVYGGVTLGRTAVTFRVRG